MPMFLMRRAELDAPSEKVDRMEPLLRLYDWRPHFLPIVPTAPVEPPPPVPVIRRPINPTKLARIAHAPAARADRRFASSSKPEAAPGLLGLLSRCWRALAS